jgi:hypothetical protein
MTEPDAPHITCIFTPSEEEKQTNKQPGAVRTEQGKWILPIGREII